MTIEVDFTGKLAWVDDLSWAALQTVLKSASEEECLKMIKHERKNKRRLQFMLRMHGRYNALRTGRERKELVQEMS